MRVVLISPLPPPSGGIATWTQGVLQYFEEDSARRELAQLDIVNTALTGNRADVVSNKRYIVDEILRTLRIVSSLMQLIKRSKADVVHLNTSGARFGVHRDALLAKIARRCGVPVVVHFRCDVRDQAEFNRGARTGFLRIIRHANRVLVLNETSARYVKAEASCPVEVVPNYSSLPVITAPKPLRDRIERVVFVGQVRKAKGVDELLAAAQRLSDVQFDVYGKVYSEYENREMPANVRLLGLADSAKIQAALDAADAFVLPSYSEGFSNALAEAMARGLPCVATDVGANAQMLSGDCGICIPMRDTEALVKALERLRPAEVRGVFSENCRKKCERLYTRDRVCQSLLQQWLACVNID